MLTNQELQTLHNMGNEAAGAANEIERLRGIVPEVLEKLNDELCSENERLRVALVGLGREHERRGRERDLLAHVVQAFVAAQTESWAEFAAAAVAANCHAMPITDKGAATVNAYQRLHATLLDMGPNGELTGRPP